MTKIVLLLPLFLFSSLWAENKILYKNKNLTFTQQNFEDFVVVGEFLGGSEFSDKEKKRFKQWTIEDFKSKPKIAPPFYKRLHETIVPKIKNPKTSPLYRVELYKLFVDAYKKHPEYTKSPDNFLAIVNSHKPPVKELLQLNQFYFNMIMQSNQASANAVNNTIQEHSLQQSVSLSGGVIIEESDNSVLVRDADGKEYRIQK